VPQHEAFRHDIQISPDAYLQLDEPWRYINHSCYPNAGMSSDVDLIARRGIKSGEEIHYDYALSDWEDWGNDAPIICCCGSQVCRKVYLGYIGLTSLDKRFYAGYIAPWLTHKEKSYDSQSFLELRLHSIAAFAVKALRFVKDLEMLQQFIEGVMYNIERIAREDIR
jgi:hypothetical protein